MPTFSLSPVEWRTDAEALRREWLVTNGLGGWASGTVAGANTRRYHGALVAALHPPVGRTLLVNKLDDWATVGGTRYGLTSNEFADGTIDPRGWEHLQRFELADGAPHWHFRLGEAELQKTVFMPHGHNAAWTVYEYTSGTVPLALEIAPLLNHRDFHGETRASDWHPAIEAVDGGVKVTLFPNAHPIWILFPGGAFNTSPAWINGIRHRVETERGQPDLEDALKIGAITATLSPGEAFAILVSAERPTEEVHHWRAAREAVGRRHGDLLRAASLDAPGWVQQLVLAADQFIVLRTEANLPAATEWRANDGPERTVIAGYHWFSDWGRDTMIALPGLTLSTGRPEVATSLLRTFARHVSRGMLPNRFPDSGEQPEYNTVDATLWYFHAVDRYVAAGDEALGRELWPVLEDIVGWHLRGTRYGIRCEADGLIAAGVPGVQLTWMDAKADDWVVTPRVGKPVEINALWINALRAMEALARRLGVRAAHDYGARAARAAASFDRFWFAEGGYLFDVIDTPEGGDDSSLRPNQLLAVSLPYAPLAATEARARAVVDVCRRALLTPYGVRSLAPDHPGFVATYGGDRYRRDGAYHQGTAWGWLIGPFVEAHFKVYGDRAQAAAFLQPLAEVMTQFGVGSLAEIYDATAPFKPEGCMAQAWSVAEALRVWRMVNGK